MERRMKKIVAEIVVLFCTLLSPIANGLCRSENETVQCCPADSSGMLVMFWNLENYFDWRDDGANESDSDFSPSGSRHWTPSRFYAKSNAIAKSVWWISDNYGKLPDVVGVAEVENRDVLMRLLHSTSLYKAGYSIVHFDSPDRRGIDVALLWRRENLEYLSALPCHVDGLQTRDILLVQFIRKNDNARMAFIVVHLPSKFGGGKTAWKRKKAASRLREVADSVYNAGFGNIVVMGDFNDTPRAGEFDVLKPLLENKSESLASKGEGTIRFNGKWDLIDMFWTTGPMSDSSSMHIVRIPFLTVRDNTMSGEKPLRTYVGPNYTGGVSDHCPVLLEVKKLPNDN